MSKHLDYSNAASLTNSLKSGIPILNACQLTVDTLNTNLIEISAPLQANINVHNTGFAGSIYVVGVICAWAMANYKMQQYNIKHALVAAEAKINYLRPINGDFSAICQAPETLNQQFQNWQRTDNLKLELESHIKSNNQRCATLKASYVILGRR